MGLCFSHRALVGHTHTEKVRVCRPGETHKFPNHVWVLVLFRGVLASVLACFVCTAWRSWVKTSSSLTHLFPAIFREQIFPDVTQERMVVRALRVSVAAVAI